MLSSNILAVAICSHKLKKYKFAMSFRSSSSSVSSEDGSELSSNANSSDIEDRGANFIAYDEDLEPVATLEKATSYEENVALEEEQELNLPAKYTSVLSRPNCI